MQDFNVPRWSRRWWRRRRGRGAALRRRKPWWCGLRRRNENRGSRRPHPRSGWQSKRRGLRENKRELERPPRALNARDEPVSRVCVCSPCVLTSPIENCVCPNGRLSLLLSLARSLLSLLAGSLLSQSHYWRALAHQCRCCKASVTRLWCEPETAPPSTRPSEALGK